MFVKQWEEKTTTLNFSSMQFVRTKEEIHLSFKNSEKQRTQALTISGLDNYITCKIFIVKTIMWSICNPS